MSESAVVSRPEASEAAAWLAEWAGSPAPVYCRDAAGRILAANQAFARKFGRSVEEFRGLPVVQCLHPEDAPAFRSLLRSGAAAAGEAGRTHRWLTPQGWRWFTWEEATLAPEENRGPIIRGVGRDVTRQRLAEELYIKLSRAVDQSPVAIVITDAAGRAQYVNPRYIQLSGLSLEDILDRNLPVLRDGHASDAAYDAFLREVTSGKEWKGELCRQRADGTVLWESVQVSCIRNAAGDITNLLCMREDITERRRLQDDLRQAQKMESLGTLAGGIAHDFNNLLAVMNGYAEIGNLHKDDPAMVQKSMREIRKAVQRASGLVRQILTFSRKADPHFAPVDLHHMVRELIALLAETFPRTVTFSLRFEDNLPALLADQNQVQQIVLNLCVNARDAMPHGGTITIRTSVRSGATLARPEADRGATYVCLEVTDTGTGMTEEVRSRIFEPFFTTKQVNQGTGLGLSVVYGIVASHRGLIEVESTVGQGSTFRIFLPAADAPMPVVPAVAAGVFPPGKESILVVDDEDPLRNLLAATLAAHGYRVTAACDGLEAIDFINSPQHAFDLVLLDQNMPGASGMAVLQVIRARRPQLRVLMVSGHLAPELRQQLENAGHSDFLGKPYGLDELGLRLRKLLDTPV